MALILFTRSRAPLMKTSRSLKNEFRKGKFCASVLFSGSVVFVYVSGDRIKLTVAPLASKGVSIDSGYPGVDPVGFSGRSWMTHKDTSR